MSLRTDAVVPAATDTTSRPTTAAELAAVLLNYFIARATPYPAAAPAPSTTTPSTTSTTG